MDHNSSLLLNDKGRKSFRNLNGKGHRKHMHSKILIKGASVLEDYEILEMIFKKILEHYRPYSIDNNELYKLSKNNDYSLPC